MARLPAKSVGTAQIKKNAVISSKIRNRSITGVDLNKLKLGIVPSAAQANNAAHSDRATNADSATAAQSAQHAVTADNATHAGTAGDASSLQGKQIAPLAAVVPPGTTDQLAGQAGPVTVRVSCGSTVTDQPITVSVTSSVAGEARFASFHLFPDGASSGTATLSAGTPANLLNNSSKIDTMGFVFTGGGSTVAGHFLADYGHGSGNRCLLSGTIGG